METIKVLKEHGANVVGIASIVDRTNGKSDIEYNLGIKDLELYIIYDIYNINEKTYELAKNSVFSEIMIDEVVEDIILQDGRTTIVKIGRRYYIV